MNFGAQSRGFSTRCLRFTNGVATIHARLASGWLARLYRERVELSGSLQKVSDHPPPLLDLAWRKGSFIFEPPSPFTSLDHIVGAGKEAKVVCSSVGKRRLELPCSFYERANLMPSGP
jgi:hypothetical protein